MKWLWSQKPVVKATSVIVSASWIRRCALRMRFWIWNWCGVSPTSALKLLIKWYLLRKAFCAISSTESLHSGYNSNCLFKSWIYGVWILSCQLEESEVLSRQLSSCNIWTIKKQISVFYTMI